MQRLEVSSAVGPTEGSLGVKGLIKKPAELHNQDIGYMALLLSE